MPDVLLSRRGAGEEVASPPSEVRERLTDAATRVASECGYVEADSELIARSAGVSMDDFHRYFDSREQCLMAAYDRFIERMNEHIDEACEAAESWPERVKLTIEAAFEFVAELHDGARLFAVDAFRAGPATVERNCTSIDSAARWLKHGRALYPAAADMPEPTERALVAGVAMLASIQLLAEETDRLPALAPEAVEMLLTPYVGARRAHRVATTA